jgi:hypothetical protein
MESTTTMHSRLSRALQMLLLTVSGCASRGPRVLDATVVNGLPGTASATPGAITGMRRGELIVTYPDGRGGSSTDHSGGPATVEFVRYMPATPGTRSGAESGAAPAPLGVAAPTPHLTISKRVGLGNGPPAAVVEVDVDVERRLGHTRVPISYFLELRSSRRRPSARVSE